MPRPTRASGRRAAKRARHGAGRHPQGGPGPEHLHLLDRLRARDDGRHPGVLHRERVRNFYSVSISGYHMAEAGANPITQLAFTLANGFTYCEYYLARGMADRRLRPELLVLLQQRPRRRVQRDRPRGAPHLGHRHARALRRSERSQKLKYHIQTSGRSLHAQEMAFNDIRTTLQALTALQDHCNSLHTNAYDEAVTTPTEESVRRALAIQLIINRELGSPKNENPLQGAYVIERAHRSGRGGGARRSSSGSRSAAACWAPWRPSTSAARSRRRACTTSRSSTPASCPIVGVNTFENPQPRAAPRRPRADPLDRRREARAARRTCAPSRRARRARPAALQRLQEVARRGRQRLRRADGDREGGEPGADQRGAVRGRAVATAARCRSRGSRTLQRLPYGRPVA